ncbi:uncharacterized protein N7511_004646 [Penicillium nucicola]|uniref:uncharacterized protein n=1 Tax=Penicillium nucicola TaxID=1850975 RepID=UPI00254517D0|nr:uncharacterized protein N7511_004646 [Penicillium nucicola]KAJ5767030.1 hypothetical protein N7511_004646 [Penicillium nucicola]
MTCAKCKQSESDTLILKKCGGCNSIWYCSKTCQKQDWDSHKDDCKATTRSQAINKAAESTAVSSETRTKEQKAAMNCITAHLKDKFAVLDVEIFFPFHALRCSSWLDSRSKKDVFKLLIDSYRLRVWDDRPYVMQHLFTNVSDFGLYLRQAEKRGDLVPEWWAGDTGVECMLFASSNDDWSSAVVDISEERIMGFYPELFMPLQMRIFAEQVLGIGLSGHSFLSTIELYLISEEGKIINSMSRN